MHERCPVVVMEVPSVLNDLESRVFFQEVAPLLEMDRPYLVFDCAQLQHVDSAGIEMLLQCMEAAMKRDGDVKLAAISPQSAAILELMRVDRVFEVFPTSKDAVRSFHIPPAEQASSVLPWYTDASLGDFKAAS